MRQLRFHYKIFLLFSVVIALLLAASGAVFLRVTVSVLEQNAAKAQTQTNQKVAEQIDSLLNEMNRISIAVNTSEEIHSILATIPQAYDGNYLDDNPRLANRIKDVLYPILELKTFEAYVLVMSPALDWAGYYGRYKLGQTKEYLGEQTRFSEWMATEEYKFIVPPGEEKLFLDAPFFGLFRPLRDPYSVWGGVYVGVPQAVLDAICASGEGTRISTVVLDEAGDALYTNMPELAHDVLRLLAENTGEASSGSFSTQPGSLAGYACAYTRLPDLGWTVVQLQDSRAYAEPVLEMRRIVLISHALAFLLLLGVLYLAVLNLTRPIRTLTSRVRHADPHRPVVSPRGEPSNEIDILGQSFQALLDNLASSNRDLVQAREREMTAHISTLQAQMNPHFLYNTLAVIGAYGKKAGNAEVAQMCAELSKMLRYAAEVSGSTTIDAEIENVRWYLNIMGRRYAGCLEQRIKLDPALAECKVPKLIVQPVVENAFVHGLRETPYPWRVEVDGYIEQGRWVIRVRDNGAGFTEERLREIEADYEAARNADKLPDYIYTAGRGIGLVNTFMRLCHFYKGREWIHCYNAETGGAVVEIGGPMDGE